MTSRRTKLSNLLSALKEPDVQSSIAKYLQVIHDNEQLGTKATQLMTLLEAGKREYGKLKAEMEQMEKSQGEGRRTREEVPPVKVKRPQSFHVRYALASLRNMCGQVEDVDAWQELGPKFPLQSLCLPLLEKKLVFALEIANQRVRSRRSSIAWLRRASSSNNLFVPSLQQSKSPVSPSRQVATTINTIKQRMFHTHFVRQNTSVRFTVPGTVDSLIAGAASMQYELRSGSQGEDQQVVLTSASDEHEGPEHQHALQTRLIMKKRSDARLTFAKSQTSFFQTLFAMAKVNSHKKVRKPLSSGSVRPPLEGITGVRGIDRELHLLSEKLDAALAHPPKSAHVIPLKQLYVEMTDVR